jgi:hypothetical protein
MSMQELREWQEMGMHPFLLRLAAIGAFAGLASWLLAFGVHLISEMSQPTTMTLILAVPRGALFGVILGLGLRWYWKSPQP